MRLRSIRAGTVLVVALALGAAGCSARWAYRQGQGEAKKGNWDLAVARLQKALNKDPDNIKYKIALENARVKASRYHAGEGRRLLAAEELWKAADEFDIACKYDPANKSACDDLVLVREQMRKREEEKERLADFEAMKARAAARVPVPVLGARDPVPITLKFTDTSVEKILETLGKLAGVNILLDQDFRDKRITVSLANVTFEEALNQLTFVNTLAYRVLDQNTLIVFQDNPQKRRRYEENLVRTFYLQNAEVNETVTLVRNLTRLTSVAGNPSLGAITVAGTLDELAYAGRLIEANDKAKGEVMVEVEILEVNRTQLKNYGIELANYAANVTLAPNQDPSGGELNLRAHLLSSLNLSDFVVTIPSTVFARFLQTDSNVRLLASPRLRAAEGKKTALRIGTEVPIPVTTFQPTVTTGSQTATSFQYRNVGVNLELTPKVNASGDITLEVSAEFSLLGEDRNVGTAANPLNVPTFLTRNMTGMLRLRDGQTSLIGGLVQGREAASFSGAVGLKHIPILNKIFSVPVKRKEETEILISITPHIVRAPKLVDEDLEPLYVGSKEAVRVPTARPPLMGLPEPSPAPSPAAPPAPPATPSPTVPRPTPPPAAAPTPGPPSAPHLAEAERPEAEEAAEPPEVPAAPSPEPPRESGPGPDRPLMARFIPPGTTSKVGATAQLNLMLMGARDLTAVTLVLSCDPSILEAVEVAPGPLLSMDGVAVSVERSVEPGKVRATFTRPKGMTGSGSIATLTVRGVAQGLGLVTVEALEVTTPEGTQRPYTPSQGRVIVTP